MGVSKNGSTQAWKMDSTCDRPGHLGTVIMEMSIIVWNACMQTAPESPCALQDFGAASESLKNQLQARKKHGAGSELALLESVKRRGEWITWHNPGQITTDF